MIYAMLKKGDNFFLIFKKKCRNHPFQNKSVLLAGEQEQEIFSACAG